MFFKLFDNCLAFVWLPMKHDWLKADLMYESFDINFECLVVSMHHEDFI